MIMRICSVVVLPAPLRLPRFIDPAIPDDISNARVELYFIAEDITVDAVRRVMGEVYCVSEVVVAFTGLVGRVA